MFLVWRIPVSKLLAVAKCEAIHEHYFAFMSEHINYGGWHLILIIRYECFNKSHVPHLLVEQNMPSKFATTIWLVHWFKQ